MCSHGVLNTLCKLMSLRAMHVACSSSSDNRPALNSPWLPETGTVCELYAAMHAKSLTCGPSSAMKIIHTCHTSRASCGRVPAELLHLVVDLKEEAAGFQKKVLEYLSDNSSHTIDANAVTADDVSV